MSDRRTLSSSTAATYRRAESASKGEHLRATAAAVDVVEPMIRRGLEEEMSRSKDKSPTNVDDVDHLGEGKSAAGAGELVEGQIRSRAGRRGQARFVDWVSSVTKGRGAAVVILSSGSSGMRFSSCKIYGRPGVIKYYLLTTSSVCEDLGLRSHHHHHHHHHIDARSTLSGSQSLFPSKHANLPPIGLAELHQSSIVLLASHLD